MYLYFQTPAPSSATNDDDEDEDDDDDAMDMEGNTKILTNWIFFSVDSQNENPFITEENLFFRFEKNI